jgi:hexosaminidase
MKSSVVVFLGLLFIILTLVSCDKKAPSDLTLTGFIPKPVTVQATGKTFKLTGETVIYYQEDVEGIKEIANILSAELSKTANFENVVEPVSETPSNGIYLSVGNEISDLGTEGYELNIEKKRAIIKANSIAGCFYGVQTLLQTLPPENPDVSGIEIPTGLIKDYPEFSFRGSMLDVARHFFGVEEVKRYIDFLSMYKMNVLHLHLSDDQGWRIEIKSWPKLTEIGGSTEVGGGEGGFYTQEQYSEIVEYAQIRNITIIPEIDMPGHTNAALASYAELNCNGKATELYTGIEVGFSTLCTSKEITYQFVDDVIRELASLTPGPYIHIGGDESHVTPLEDYIPFINRVQQIVKNHNKKVIGWDEIAHADLIENSVVQFWDNEKNTTMGIEKGAKVIVSPASKAYLDMKYDSTTELGLSWAGFIEVDHGYSWNPVELHPLLTKENILGIEAPLWSETVTDINEIEYMVFPRLPGYAEIGWTKPDFRNWDEYKLRLAKHGKRFEAKGINYYRSSTVPWE